MIGMAYLPSDVSGELEITYRGSENKFFVNGKENKKSNIVFREVVKKLNRNKKLIGGRILTLGAIKQKPGESQHFGSTMPMAESPDELETDRLGKLKSFNSVFIVDTSVLPDIPGTPTTILAMVNAIRIVYQSNGNEG